MEEIAFRTQRSILKVVCSIMTSILEHCSQCLHDKFEMRPEETSELLSV